MLMESVYTLLHLLQVLRYKHSVNLKRKTSYSSFSFEHYLHLLNIFSSEKQDLQLQKKKHYRI